jgi:hypothetical protein
VDTLPARVRAQALAGVRVPATRDFLALVWMILRFQRRHWQTVIERARQNSTAPLFILVGSGRPHRKVAAVRRRLRHLKVPAQVIPLCEFNLPLAAAAGDAQERSP